LPLKLSKTSFQPTGPSLWQDLCTVGRDEITAALIIFL
jgi:hypothetical protein